MSEPKDLMEYLKSVDFEMSAEDLAEHRKFLADGSDVLNGLKALIQRFEDRSFAGGGKFSNEQMAELVRAKRALDGALVPLGLLKEKAKKKPKLLKRAYDYER